MNDRILSEASPSTVARPDPALLQKAAGFVRAGNLLEAARLFDGAARKAAQPGPLLLEAGRLYLRAGDKAAARTSLEGAVAADPTLASAQVNLGLLQAELGNPRAGLAALEAAAALKPDDPDIAVNLAVVEASFHPARSLERLRSVLARHPDHRLALVNLASAAHKSGLHEEAVAGFERLIAKEPAHLSWRIQRAAALLGDGRLDEARLAYQEILDRDPGNRSALAGLARRHRIAGAPAAEIEIQRRILALDPDHVGALAGLARLGALTEDARLHMSRLAAAPMRRPVERYPLHYVLFDLADREPGLEPAAAFAHLAEANRLKAEAGKAMARVYDAAAEEAETERIIRVFDAEWFARLARAAGGAGHRDERPVFVVGMPRSGTTLCEQILASHSQMSGLGERIDIARIAEELTLDSGDAWPEALASLDPARLRTKAWDYLRLLDRVTPGALRAVDKTPTNFRYLGLIAALFPQARIIHARRGPMDVGFSCFEQNFTQSYPWSTSLRDIGHYYGLYCRLMAHWQRVLPRPMLDWHYENVVADLEPAARRLIEFCGLDFEPACLAFHEMQRPIHTASLEQVRRPLYQSSVGKWRRHAAMLEPLAQSLKAHGA
ncbi:MAG: tetratricopeptide repeat-containing sulfotransferase family protein, partial [Hypericibacter sp.]